MLGFGMGRGKELKGRVEEEMKEEKRMRRHIRKLLKKQIS
jgi:hypothetical protein